MSSELFSIHGKYELLALHRGLMEARFCEIANDLDVSGSPILAKIHRDVVAVLVSLKQPVGGDSSQWKRWLSLDSNRREWKIAVSRATASSWWWRLDSADKVRAAKDLLSPFELDDQQVREFVNLVDALGPDGG